MFLWHDLLSSSRLLSWLLFFFFELLDLSTVAVLLPLVAGGGACCLLVSTAAGWMLAESLALVMRTESLPDTSEMLPPSSSASEIEVWRGSNLDGPSILSSGKYIHFR